MFREGMGSLIPSWLGLCIMFFHAPWIYGEIMGCRDGLVK